jgi:hypothetical protein
MQPLIRPSVRPKEVAEGRQFQLATGRDSYKISSLLGLTATFNVYALKRKKKTRRRMMIGMRGNTMKMMKTKWRQRLTLSQLPLKISPRPFLFLQGLML